MKKTVSLLLVMLMLLSLGVSASAEPNQSRAVIGADLTDEQIAAVYQAFGVARGSVVELRVNNQEERTYLEGYVSEALIGTRSISCVYVELLPAGSGMQVSTSNITWCTPEMYLSALATAGILDVKIIVASPYAVSGTAALTGVYKAYEDMTGQPLNDLAKLISTQELTITGDLASEIGALDSTAIVNDLKNMLDETRNMTDAQLREIIIQIAGEYGVELKETHIQQLITLCRAFEVLDYDALRARVEQVQRTLSHAADAKLDTDRPQGIAGTVSHAVESIDQFFKRVGRFLGL
jgi:uncharacterized protein YpuA (DUF1002 family)